MESPIAKNLIYQRKLKGFTQEQLSEKTQVTVRTIQRIEKGDVTPHLQTIKLLAAALNIAVEDILPLENPKEEAIQKKWLLLLHATPILGFVIPLSNILFPLFLWIHKREDHKIYDMHGRKIINFQITMTLLFALAFIGLVTVEKFGFLFFIAVIPYAILVILINIIRAVNVQKCFYFPAIPFIRQNKSRPLATMAIFVGLFILLANCTHTPRTQNEIVRLDGSSIQEDTLNDVVHHLMKEGHVQGMGLALFDDNQLVYEKAYGYRNFLQKLPLTDSTNMYGASFSKAVFSVLVMKLVEEGVIDLDTPLESYLPKKIYEYTPKTRWHDDYSALKDDSLYHQITARMCLDHTTGLPNWRWFEPDYKLRVHFQPGSRYMYSGEGMVYLQVVLEKITGKGLEELAQEKIFRPLHMEHTSYHWKASFEDNFAYGHKADGSLYKKDKDNEPRAASTLETTLDDYTKFLQAVLQHKLLSEDSWDEIFKPQIRIHSTTQFGPLSTKDTDRYDHIELSYGLGWGIIQTPYGFGAFKEGHGDGFQHYSILFPESGKGILIMTNSDNGEGIFKYVLENAMEDIYTPWRWENYIPFNKKNDGSDDDAS